MAACGDGIDIARALYYVSLNQVVSLNLIRTSPHSDMVRRLQKTYFSLRHGGPLRNVLY